MYIFKMGMKSKVIDNKPGVKAQVCAHGFEE